MTEANKQIKNGAVLKFLKDYWFILAAIVAMSVAFSELRSQAIANHVVNEQQQVQIDTNTSEVNELEKRYIEDVTFIKTTLENLQ